MRSTSRALPESTQAQVADLLNLAATIDRQAQLQLLHENVRAGLNFIATYALFDAVSAMQADGSDLSSNVPEIPAAWREGAFRRQNSPTAGASNARDPSAGASAAVIRWAPHPGKAPTTTI